MRPKQFLFLCWLLGVVVAPAMILLLTNSYDAPDRRATELMNLGRVFAVGLAAVTSAVCAIASIKLPIRSAPSLAYTLAAVAIVPTAIAIIVGAI